MNDDEGVSSAEPPAIGLLALLVVLWLAFISEAVCRAVAAMGLLRRTK